MQLFQHLLKRLLLILLGYVVSVAIGLVAIVIFYTVLSALPNAPDYFSAMSMTPYVVLVVPPIALFVYWLTIVLTGAQALVLVVFAELFELRGIFVHALFGLIAAVSGFAMIALDIFGGIDGTDWADFGIIAAAGIVAGIF